MKMEVEVRGPLTNKEYNTLCDFLSTNGSEIYTNSEVVLFLQENKKLGIKKDIFRLKKKGKKEILQFKNRFGEEIEIELEKGGIEKMLKLLNVLGFEKVSIAPAFRRDFLYKGVKFSLKSKCIIGPHYEAEIIVSDKDRIQIAKEKLMKTINELKLKAWNENEYLEHKARAWKNIKPINIEKILKVGLNEVLGSYNFVKDR